MLRIIAQAAAAALALAFPVAADTTILVEDAHALASGPTAVSGAVFMRISNTGDVDDRLVAASANVARRVEIHTHLFDASGVARMVEVEDGVVIPAGESHALERGGDHVMLMGLHQPLADGAIFSLTLKFENAGEITVDVILDLDRRPSAPQGMGG